MLKNNIELLATLYLRSCKRCSTYLRRSSIYSFSTSSTPPPPPANNGKNDQKHVPTDLDSNGSKVPPSNQASSAKNDGKNETQTSKEKQEEGIPPPSHDQKSIDSILAGAGCDPSDPATGAIVPPIYLATTYERTKDTLELLRGFDYSRTGNPTRNLFQHTMTKLENGKESFAFSSGMQSAMALITCAGPNSFILLPDDLYHGIYHLLTTVYKNWNIHFEKNDMTDLKSFKSKLEQIVVSPQYHKFVIWLETPSNPRCKVTDIKSVHKVVSKVIPSDKSLLVVDSTWCTPYLCRPLDLGADIVMHSSTKYINGHSDSTGGVVTFGHSLQANAIIDQFRTIHQIGGGILSPFDSWLTLRGMRTLAVRMKQHCDNAMAVAEYLEGHKGVEKVFYPGLANHPQNEIASVQMNGRYGGMLSILVKPKKGSTSVDETALNVVKSVKLFKRATSLGGTESLIEHRASVEGPHGNSPKNLLRLSIGIEDVGDLIADLEVALNKAMS